MTTVMNDDDVEFDLLACLAQPVNCVRVRHVERIFWMFLMIWADILYMNTLCYAVEVVSDVIKFRILVDERVVCVCVCVLCS